MRLTLAALCLCLLGAVSAGAETAVEAASRASADLRESVQALKAAEGAKNRVAALSTTIRAYERGLAVMREATRRAAAREAELRAGFDAQRDRIGQLLAVMSGIERASAPLLLLHPDGPLGTARSGLILSSVTPALEAEAAKLASDLREIQMIRAIQAESEVTLRAGLVAAQEARTALSQAVQDRTDLPRRFLEDPEELKQLLAGAETLDAFAEGIAGLESDIGPPMDDFEGAMGTLRLPVFGALLRRFGEADAAGIRRPGLLIATRPAALVSAPWPATIRYRGPLLDYGNVMILEPASGYLLILAGMAEVYGDTGDVVEEGAPLGLMGPADRTSAEFPASGEEGSGAGRTETLYLELRQGKTPVDPAPWFTETRND